MIGANLISSAVALIIFRVKFDATERYTCVNRATTPLIALTEIPKQVCTYTVNSNDNVFPSNASANVHAFFTGAVENFLERSEQFKNWISQVCNVLTKLLNPNSIMMKSK